jgi:hypothetical protein
MTSVASWAHRALRGAACYHHCRDEPEYCERYSHGVDEDVIGVYENPAGVTPQAMVITERGMYIRSDEGMICLEFNNLHSIRGPDTKTGDGAIQIAEQDGRSSIIRVEGGDGKYRDVYSMVRFLDRVAAHKRGERE